VPAKTRANHFSVDLRRLTLLIGTAITLFGLLLLAIIAYAGWSANQTATEIERTLLDNALNQSIARALNEQKSIAWWDDPVVKITDKVLDMEFTDANFGVFLTETYAHDEVYILNAEDKPIYAFGEAKTQDPLAFERRRPELDALIAEIRQADRSKLKARPDMLSESKGGYRVLTGVQVARWAGHIVSIEGRPAVVAGMTIVPNIDPTLLKGTPNLLLSITYIDDAFISDVGNSLLLADLTLTPQVGKGDGIVSEPLVGDDGTPVGFLNWSTRRPGQVLLTIILPLVALAILGTGALTAIMLRRLGRTSEELARREAQARYEAKHDPLSGLPNRVQMVEKIEAFLRGREIKGEHRRAIAAYIDIDRFKDINDTLGHEAGDNLIKAVAARLKSRLRSTDFLSRFGGDEFAILCSPAGIDGGANLADRVAAAFATPFNIQNQNIRVSASVGIATAPENGNTAPTLIGSADFASVGFAIQTQQASQANGIRRIDLEIAIKILIIVRRCSNGTLSATPGRVGSSSGCGGRSTSTSRRIRWAGRGLLADAVAPTPVTRHVDNAMVKVIARAFRWRELLENGTYATIAEMATAEKINETYVGRVLRLTLLAPDIVEAIMGGRHPAEITLASLMRRFPVGWREQRVAMLSNSF
jgi:diguanylate cyclase (GGDEF)-like protein